MTVGSTTTLQDALDQAEQLPWSAVLFLPPDPSTWSTDTTALVVAEDEVDDNDGHPEATRLGLKYAFGVSDLQAVKVNALLQRPKATSNDLVTALCFYFSNDAFVVWS